MSGLKPQTAPQDKMSDSLLQVNRLSFRLPAEIGVARSKQVVVDNFQRSSYTTGRMILDAQTGSAFVAGRESWVEFNLVASHACGFGQGSALNVIQEVLVKGRGGREICRVERANLLMKNVQGWEMSPDYVNTIGGCQGLGTVDVTGTSAPDTDRSLVSAVGTGTRYCIPLSALAPCFDQSRLLPPQLMEGLRIELTLEGFKDALVKTVTAPTSFTIDSPEIHWSTVNLADQFKRKINEMAATRGLNLLHKEYFHMQDSASSGQHNFDVRKAASKALKLLVVSRVDSLVTDAGAVTDFDAMGSESFLYENAQSHIGSDYFPVQKIEAVSATDYASFYQHTARAMDKMSNFTMPSSITLPAYGRANTTAGSKAIYAVRLNKSGVSDLDGYQTNNSRALISDIKFSTAVARTLDIWLQHLRAVKVYQSGIDVKD